MAPLKWGGRNGIFTPFGGIGIDVLLGELIQRLATQNGGRTVQIGIEQGAFTEESRRLQWRNYGMEELVETFFAREADSAARRRHVVEKAVQRARALAAEQPVLFIAYSHIALSDGVMAILDGLRDLPNVTLLLAGTESIGAEPPALQSLDAALTFDRERARQSLWPAIDALRSYSTTYQDEEHQAKTTAARRLFARYRDLGEIYNQLGMSGFDMALFGDAEREAVLRARRLHRFLAQPLFIAEAWSAVPGEFVPLAETLQTTEAIRAGKLNETAENELTNIGSWSPKWT
jgi:F-type H+-transporting ATPase subunit beta